MIRLALSALLAHKLRSAVLAGGFGVGVSVIANLLGIGGVMLEQAGAPALRGGGDLLVAGSTGRVTSARFLLGSVLDRPAFADRVTAASPNARRTLYLVREDGRSVPVEARGGVPSLERALGDAEIADAAAWTDAPDDHAWTAPDAAAVLRAMDRFHPIPDVPARADSWAEWLYFNGRAGGTRFYLTFLVGPQQAPGRRLAGVRLQLDEDGRRTSWGETAEVDAARVLADAPDLDIGRSFVRLEGGRYRIALDLPRLAQAMSRTPGPGVLTPDGAAGGGAPGGAAGDVRTRDDLTDEGGAPGAAIGQARITGELVLDPDLGRSLPPFTIRGARGWTTGYTVPVMSGRLDGALRADGRTISFADGAGYHDHNWGHWEGVSWQWGQVAGAGLSFVYGRVFPPADAADPEHMPGFLLALGPDGPEGYATNVSIDEHDTSPAAGPERITVRARSRALDLTFSLDIVDRVVSRMDGATIRNALDFHQMRATYHVRGRVDDRPVDFTASGAAETFRNRRAPE